MLPFLFVLFLIAAFHHIIHFYLLSIILAFYSFFHSYVKSCPFVSCFCILSFPCFFAFYVSVFCILTSLLLYWLISFLILHYHLPLYFSLSFITWLILDLVFSQVIQGIIKDADWTSYNLVNPIHTRFIRILPQAWEGNEICTLVEFYSNDNKGLL